MKLAIHETLTGLVIVLALLLTGYIVAALAVLWVMRSWEVMTR